MKQFSSSVLIIGSWLFVFAFRFLLLPLRAPNVEPLLATVMPLRKMGVIGSALFAFSSIFLYDVVTAGIGNYTWYAGVMYALIAAASPLYFARFESTRFHFLAYGVVSTLLFDFVTGPVMISMLDGLPFVQVLTAQIPFTLMHLAGTALFALTLSPVLAYLAKESEQTVASANGVPSSVR